MDITVVIGEEPEDSSESDVEGGEREVRGVGPSSDSYLNQFACLLFYWLPANCLKSWDLGGREKASFTNHRSICQIVHFQRPYRLD